MEYFIHSLPGLGLQVSGFLPYTSEAFLQEHGSTWAYYNGSASKSVDLLSIMFNLYTKFMVDLILKTVLSLSQENIIGLNTKHVI